MNKVTTEAKAKESDLKADKKALKQQLADLEATHATELKERKGAENEEKEAEIKKLKTEITKLQADLKDWVDMALQLQLDSTHKNIQVLIFSPY